MDNNNDEKIFIDLLLASVWVSCFGIAANYILSIILEEPWPEDYALLKMSLPVVLWNSMIVLLIEIFFYQQSQMEAEKKLAIIEKEKIQYQYETLKAQINPHFLFNSLNVLSSLAYSDAEKTNLFAKKLSGVYRYLLLTNNRPMVTLKEELAFLESYVFLEKIRFEDTLFIEIDEYDLYGTRLIIPVSLQRGPYVCGAVLWAATIYQQVKWQDSIMLFAVEWDDVFEVTDEQTALEMELKQHISHILLRI